MSRKWRSNCLMIGAALLAACESPTHPSGTLSSDDAQFLASALDAGAGLVLDGYFGPMAAGPALAPALADGPLVTTFSFERSRDCPEGGTLTLAGSGSATWDATARTYDIEAEGTKERDACAFARGDVVITVTGTAEWTHERHWLERQPTGLWVTAHSGDFEWSKSTGESGNCTFDLVRTIDTAANTLQLAGTFCGRQIDWTRTWRS